MNVIFPQSYNTLDAYIILQKTLITMKLYGIMLERCFYYFIQPIFY